MSFKAVLTFNGKPYNILHCSFSFRRDYDAKGRPSSIPHGGTVQFEIESTEDVSILQAAVVTYHKASSGHVEFFKREDTSVMKKLTFEDAYIVQYTESIDSVGSNPMAISFVISARVLSVEDAKHENEWPKTS